MWAPEECLLLGCRVQHEREYGAEHRRRRLFLWGGTWALGKLHADMGNRDLRNPEEFKSSGDVLTAILSHSDSQAVVKHEREYASAEHRRRRLLL
jgi:hypothetical protein